MVQGVRPWTRKEDYTAIVFQGVVPRSVITTSDAVEIPTRQRENVEFPNLKRSGGLVQAKEVIAEIWNASQNTKRDFLPTAEVMNILRRSIYYNLLGTFDSTPADVTQWSDPPHVELANCELATPEDVKRFVEMYGVCPAFVDDKKLSPEVITISIERLQKLQAVFRGFWDKTDQVEILNSLFSWSPDEIHFESGKPQITVRDISDYITILFLIDLSADRLRVCGNPHCKQLKYFVKERRDQKYCSTTCKNTVNVYKWLGNEQNRNNWNADRRKVRKAKAKTARGGRS
jgi:hypothetical protein